MSDKKRPSYQYASFYHELHSLPDNLGVVPRVPLKKPLQRDVHLVSPTYSKAGGVEGVIAMHKEAGIVILKHYSTKSALTHRKQAIF